MVALKRAPSSTASSVWIEMSIEIATPTQVIQCAPRRPMVLPNRPAATAPTSGASGTMVSSVGFRLPAIASALQRVELVDIDRRAIAEQHDQDRQADRRFGGRDRENEEHEHLAGHRVGARRIEVVRERDEVQ